MNDYKRPKKNLETVHFNDEELIQTEISKYVSENIYLKNSLKELRKELENQAYSKHKSVQASQVDNKLNIKQLKNLIISFYRAIALKIHLNLHPKLYLGLYFQS